MSIFYRKKQFNLASFLVREFGLSLWMMILVVAWTPMAYWRLLRFPWPPAQLAPWGALVPMVIGAPTVSSAIVWHWDFREQLVLV